jgi:antitoxin component of RelBE/YafQ-DinJ toxin-antitoxin module
MRLLILACVTALAMPQAAAQKGLSQKDRDAGTKYLEETRARFLASIDGLSDAQWTYKAGPDRWSIAEVAEHIAISESTILGMVTDQILKTPEVPADPGRPTDEKVIQTITDRSSKAQAPEMLKPTNRWPTRASLTKDFEASRQRTIDYLKTTKDDLRGHARAHPALKTIDGYQWVLLLAAHSARHTAQIEEVKSAAGFPKGGAGSR